MIWVAVAALLIGWLVGLLLMAGPIVNLLLMAVGVLLVVAVIRERDGDFD